MKNKNHTLTELKVKSFVTNIKEGEENTVKGGYTESRIGCYTKPFICDLTVFQCADPDTQTNCVYTTY